MFKVQETTNKTYLWNKMKNLELYTVHAFETNELLSKHIKVKSLPLDANLALDPWQRKSEEYMK